MSILIKGMEMPSEQYGKMVITLYPNGHVAEYVGDIGRVWEAVPVPPHGDLIDRDALMAEFEKAENAMERHGREFSFSFISSGQEISTEWFAVETMVEDAPTIIPAEEVYGQFTDTAGNLHWTGTHSGEHIIQAEEGER